jgi:hypothetical protein
MTTLMELIDRYAAVSTGAVPDADRYKIGLRIQEARAAVVAEVEKLEAAQYRPAPCHKFCEATAFKIVIRNLESENAKLERDAARYRWMRDYLPSDDTSCNEAIVAAITPEELNAAIDKARGEHKMNKVIELAREARLYDHNEESSYSQAVLRDLEKFYTLCRADLEAENEKLKKDAARYQWMREYLPSDETSCDEAIIAALTPEELDAAIDAALEKRND